MINGRKPLETDKLLLNYDIDSEEEWEVQDEMGEELNSEEDEFDNEGQSQSSTFDNESSDNNSWIVPNGYLSDYEGAESDNSEKNFEHIERSENKVCQIILFNNWFKSNTFFGTQRMPLDINKTSILMKEEYHPKKWIDGVSRKCWYQNSRGFYMQMYTWMLIKTKIHSIYFQQMINLHQLVLS